MFLINNPFQESIRLTLREHIVGREISCKFEKLIPWVFIRGIKELLNFHGKPPFWSFGNKFMKISYEIRYALSNLFLGVRTEKSGEKAMPLIQSEICSTE